MEVIVGVALLSILVGSASAMISMYQKQSYIVSQKISSTNLSSRIEQVLSSPSLCSSGLIGQTLDLSEIPEEGLPIELTLQNSERQVAKAGASLDGVKIGHLSIVDAANVNSYDGHTAYRVRIDYSPKLTGNENLSTRSLQFSTYVVSNDSSDEITACAGNHAQEDICKALGADYNGANDSCVPPAAEAPQPAPGAGSGTGLSPTAAQQGKSERYLANCESADKTQEFYAQRWVDGESGPQQFYFYIEGKNKLTKQVVCATGSNVLPFSKSDRCHPFKDGVGMRESASGDVEGLVGNNVVCTAQWKPDHTGDGGIYGKNTSQGERTNCCMGGRSPNVVDYCEAAWRSYNWNDPEEWQQPNWHACRNVCRNSPCYYYGQRID